MMSHVGCKHLDYEPPFLDCELCTIKPEGWKYWKRLNPPYEGAPVQVQFCKQRGRVNGIFDCINPGEKSCYEAQEDLKEPTHAP